MKVVVDGVVFSLPLQSYSGVALQKELKLSKKVLATKVGTKLIDAFVEVSADEVELITTESPDAIDILNHSAAHLMAQAVAELFPNACFGVGPSIKEGFYYDIKTEEPLREEDLERIENKMRQLSKEDSIIKRREISKQEAKEIFTSDRFKSELIDELEGVISVYEQGRFVDLCRGPHIGRSGAIKHFKLLNLAGSYWRGDSARETMQRIYGVAFFDNETLQEHLKMLEERKQRDHRRIGKEMKLFMFSPLAGQGLPIILPNGMVIIQELQKYILERERHYEFKHVSTPLLGSIELYQTSGHLEHYKENMFPELVLENDTLMLRPMSCPHHILVYRNDLHSYRDLPLRLAEQVMQYRFEASGALTGLERVRAMNLTDSHIFCTQEQISSEFLHALNLIIEVLQALNIKVSFYRLSLHDTINKEKYFDDEALWNKSENMLREVLKANNIDFVEAPGEAAFYGPKLDIQIETALGRDITLSTLQLDYVLPERFDLHYIDENGEKRRPVMIHRGLIGTYERFMAILIEQTKGVFPLWLAPVQVSVLPVVEVLKDRARPFVERFKNAGIRVNLDARNEKLGYRLRQAQVNKIPYSVVIGEKEVENMLVTYRKYNSEEQTTVAIDEFIKMLQVQVENKK